MATQSKHILLINLGSPKSLDTQDVKIYLNEFLSDDLVIDLPKALQQFILRAFILPFRPKKTKEAYELIWEDAGSPLIINTHKIADALAKLTDWSVDIAMRYQEPSIRDAISRLKEKRVREVTIVPLYPHNAMSTTTTTALAVEEIIDELYPDLNATIVEPFFDHPKYIQALAESIKPYIDDKTDRLLFSYHGIPERHARKPDPTSSHCLTIEDCCTIDCASSQSCYRSNVYTATEKVAKVLELDQIQWMLTFQSRVNIIDPKWLKPYTDKELAKLPKSGEKNVAVVCPSFVADCLETLEEINIRGRKTFMDAGGTNFTWIPCMNDSPALIKCLESVVRGSFETISTP